MYLQGQEWNNFRQPVLLLTNNVVSLLMREKLYTNCVHGCMLHGSEMLKVKKENKLTVEWAEMRMIRWMCGVKVTDKVHVMCSH